MSNTSIYPQVFINGVDFTQFAQIGFVNKETQTEELDSATLILNNVPRQLFESFNRVVVTLENSKQAHLFVNTSSEDLFNIEENRYTHIHYSLSHKLNFLKESFFQT